MNQFHLIIKVILTYGCLSIIFCNSLLFQYQDKPNCKQILMEIHTMSDSMILDYGDYDVMFPPDIYCPEEYTDHIFAVPVENTVGTNDIDNAVSLLHFKKDSRLDRQVIKKDFMEMVTGPFDFRYLPVWSENEIAYSQAKAFLIINLHKKNVETHIICDGIFSGDIGNVAVLDSATRTFVFEILMSAGENERKVLQVIRFDNDTFNILSEHPAGMKTCSYTEPWFIYQNTIFIYNDSTTSIDTYDENFQNLNHPLSDAFKEKRNTFRCLREILVHPFLPFALVVEHGKWPTKDQLSKFDSLTGLEWDKATDILYNEANRRVLYLFRWTHPDPKQRLIPLVSSAGSIWNSYNPENAYSDFTFSPDGRWVVFRDKSESGDNPVFVAVPVDEKNPLLLGKPVKLGKTAREGSTGPAGTAWSTGPTAFVMCDGAVLYRWVLDDVETMGRVAVPKGTPEPWVKETQ